MTDSYIVNIFLAPPNKTEALAYLDGSAPKPGRYANVVVIRGTEDVPDVMEYKVFRESLAICVGLRCFTNMQSVKVVLCSAKAI